MDKGQREPSMGMIRVLIAIVLAATLVNCAKGKSGPSTSAPSIASNNVAGQTIVCPISGYYLYNGTNYPCTPGQSVVVGQGVPAPAPAPLPGPAPLPVTPAPPQGVPPQNSCDAWTAQYNGVVYVVAFYQGQYVCMREDIAIYYGLAVY